MKFDFDLMYNTGVTVEAATLIFRYAWRAEEMSEIVYISNATSYLIYVLQRKNISDETQKKVMKYAEAAYEDPWERAMYIARWVDNYAAA